MLFRSISNNTLAQKEEQELIATLRTYGTFYVSEIGNGIWCANLECRPCVLSPIHSTKTNKMAAVRCVEMQVKGAMEIAASLEPF
jgi:hypothetical protein